MSDTTITLVDQYDGNGNNSGMEMLTADLTWPNLIIHRAYDHWDVSQAIEDWYDDYDESGCIPDEYVRHVGSFPVTYSDESLPFLRSYSEEETNTALLKLLKSSDVAWCAW